MNKLDQAINDISNELVPEDRIEQAAARVRHKLFGQTRQATERIRGCADYQTLIPAYLNRTLSAGRALLLQDHTRECPACRHSLDQARGSSVRMLSRPVTPPSTSIPRWWAIAAMVVVAVGVGALIVSQVFLPGSGRMTVASVHGILYTVSDRAVTPVFPGREIAEGQKVRVAKDSSALVKLADGSLVELNERAELYVNRSGHGAVIHLDRGNIIVQAAKQRHGTLDVLTPDCVVSVKGTIFSVDRGTKGSRVSVVEGVVEVAQGSQRQLLKPGEQATTNSTVAKTSVAEAVAWSRDSDRYVALLGEFSIIRKGLEAMPSPALRHDSKLLPYVPSDTVLYASIPNLGPTLSEAERLFQSRLKDSAVLREWWDQQKDGPKLEAMLQKLRTFSDYLGDEIVFTVSGDWEGNYSHPLVLAEVKKPGLGAYLESEFRTLGGQDTTDVPQVVGIRKAAGARKSRQKSGPMLVGVEDNLLAIAWSQDQIDKLADRISESQPVPADGLLGHVKDAYNGGAGYLLCVNMEQIARSTGDRKGSDGPKLPTGLDAMRYLIVERKDTAGKTENQATLTFEGRRSGIAAWLAPPAPMGSLDFVSPNATFAVSMVLRSPKWMLSDVLASLSAADPHFEESLERVRKETGLYISPELGEPLGGEITFAVDGPLLPLPSWKLIVEVYSPDRLQAGIEQIVNAINANTKCPECGLALTSELSSGRTYYTLTSKQFSYEIDYSYVDGYLVAAPSRTLLATAIQNRATGYTLPQSQVFRSQLPVGGNLDFSALVYHNVGSALKPLASHNEAMAALLAGSGPGLIYAYGQEDKITIASAGTFFGLDLNSVALPSLLARAMHR